MCFGAPFILLKSFLVYICSIQTFKQTITTPDTQYRRHIWDFRSHLFCVRQLLLHENRPNGGSCSGRLAACCLTLHRIETRNYIARHAHSVSLYIFHLRVHSQRVFNACSRHYVSIIPCVCAVLCAVSLFISAAPVLVVFFFSSGGIGTHFHLPQCVSRSYYRCSYIYTFAHLLCALARLRGSVLCSLHGRFHRHRCQMR